MSVGTRPYTEIALPRKQLPKEYVQRLPEAVRTNDLLAFLQRILM